MKHHIACKDLKKTHPAERAFEDAQWGWGVIGGWGDTAQCVHCTGVGVGDTLVAHDAEDKLTLSSPLRDNCVCVIEIQIQIQYK